MKTVLSPRDLADAIGVSESSVKRWVDSGRIAASKTEGGHRRIALADGVRFVRETRAAVEKPELLGLAEITAARPQVDAGEEGEVLFEFLRRGDSLEARGFLSSLYLDGRSMAWIIDGPLREAMERIGELWHGDPSGVYREHRATDIAIQALNRLRVLAPAPESAPLALGGAPLGDPYFMPTLAAAAVLESEGLRAINLGPQTPVDSLRVAARELGPRLVWLSASVVTEPDRLSRQLTKLLSDLRSFGATLIMGGRGVDKLRLPKDPLLYVGKSMVELEALVQGLRSGAHSAAAATPGW